MSTKPTAERLRTAVGALENREKAEFFPRFFKSDRDNRAEVDLFLGVTVPKQRQLAKQLTFSNSTRRSCRE